MSKSIFIIKKSLGSPTQQLKLGEHHRIVTQADSVYSLVDAETGVYPDGVTLQQESGDLLVIMNGDVVLVLNDYFEEGKQASFDELGQVFTATDYNVTENSQVTQSPVWSAETDTLISLNDQDTTNKTTLKNSTDKLSEELNTQSESVESIGWEWYVGALGLGLLGAGGSGGSSSSSSSGSAATNSVAISAAAGTFTSTVKIDVYDTSGNLLVTKDHNYSEGDYVYTGTYSGPILIEISDINDSAVDYIDEATGESKSLGTTLRAMMNTNGSADTAVSVTPLTELATQLAGVTGKAITAENVVVNTKVAELFGLTSITDKPAVVTEDTSGASDAAIQYGQALAILSGADSESGNTNAADTIAKIADSLKEVNSDATAPLKLTSDVADLLIKGLEAYNSGPTGRDNAITTTFSFSSVPVLVNGAGETISILNADSFETESSINVKIKGLEAGNTVTLKVGENSVGHAVTADDMTNGYVPITNSWFGDDGNYDVVVTVGTSDSVTTIKVDTTAPKAPTFALHQDTGESDSDNITSDTTVDVTLAADAASWQYSLDGGTNWVTRTSGNSFELKGSTIYDAEQIQVKQLDKAGNESLVTSNESAITTLKTSAPELGLKEDTGSSASDGITKDTTVEVTFDEGVELASWQYSLNGGATWSALLNDSDTSFELAANTTYAADTIQVKQIDTAGNEEIVTLSTKVVTDNTAGTPIAFLVKDTGENTKDGVTNDATYKVNLAKDTESWEYRLSSDSAWVTGEGSSFELAENTTYEIGAIQVRQTDIAGNVSAVKSNAIEITTDTSVLEAPSFVLANDTGSEAADGITNDATINVTLSDDAARWEYRLSSNGGWVTGQGTSFELAENTTYESGTIQVRQTDAAGNVSGIGSNLIPITTDTDSPDSPPNIGLDKDTGFSDEDDITNVTQVNVELRDGGIRWEYSLNHGETWSESYSQSGSFNLVQNTAYAADDIKVRQYDIAGNVSAVASNYESPVITDNLLSEPTLEIVGNLVTVTLENDVTEWSYSLNSGQNTSKSNTHSFQLVPETTYPANSIVVYQTDRAGNSSTYQYNVEVTTPEAYAAPTLVLATDSGVAGDGITNDTTISVTLSDDAASWEYRLSSNGDWVTGQGSSFELAENTTYEAGTIQVRQTDAAGNVSTIGSNASSIVTDTLVTDIVINIETTGADEIELSDYQNVEIYQVGDGELIQMWRKPHDNDNQTLMNIRKISADGEAISSVIDFSVPNPSFDGYYVNTVLPVGDGSVVVSWQGYNNDDGSPLFFQLLDETLTPIGSVQTAGSTSEWHNDSNIIALESSNQYALAWMASPEESNDSSVFVNAYLQLFDQKTGKKGALLTFENGIGHFVHNVDDGKLLVMWNEVVTVEPPAALVKFQTYDSNGNPLDDVANINSDTDQNYSEGFFPLGSDGAFVALMVREPFNNSAGNFSLQTVGADGVLANPVLLGNYQGNQAQVSISIVNDQNDFALTWFGINASDTATVYTQQFYANGTAKSDAVPLPMEFATDYEYNVDSLLIGGKEEGQSFIQVRSSYKDDDNQYFNESKVYFVDKTTVNTIAASEENDAWSEFGIKALNNEAGDVLVYKNGQDQNSTNSDSWFQIYKADGTSKTDKIVFTDNLDYTVINSKGDFLVSWTEQQGYFNDSVWIPKATNYTQLYNADGNLITPIEIDSGESLEFTAGEGDYAYLVSADKTVEDLADITDLGDNLWNMVEISEGSSTSTISTKGLIAGDYYLYVGDEAGNITQHAEKISITHSDVMFDLVAGQSTDLGNQTFDADETYNIYINIGDGSDLTLNSGEQWSGADNLGEDDTIILRHSELVISTSISDDQGITWTFGDSDTATLTKEGVFTIADKTVDLWTESFTTTPEVMVQVTTESSDV